MRRRPPADLHCPYCYEPFGRWEIEFRCSGRTGWGGRRCQPEPDKVLSVHIGREVTAPPAFAAETPGTQAACPRCGVSTTTRICPACHRPLPALFGRIPSRMIALVGAKESGKTVFMTVLVRELMHRLGDQLQATISPADDYTGHEFASYYEALLYGSDQLLPPTAPAAASDRTPLVFRLTVGGPGAPGPRRGRGSGRGLSRGSPARPALLSLFDPAGEDLLSQQSAEQNARYLAAADAIVLLLDPLQMPAARKLAAAGTRLPSPPRGAADTPVSVLQNITDLVLRTGQAGSDGLISKPLAVAFSKIDAFQRSLDPTSPLRQAPVPGPWLDEADSLSVHTEVQRLLDRWDGSLIDRIVRQHYGSHRYFGISALGETPTATNQVSERGIRPYRVGDPLTWILSTLGVIPVRGGAEMAFQQLHYTSCQDGPAGYSGFQFSATTPGTAPAVLREVEELIVYQPPAWLLASPSLGEPDAYPVMFAHAASPSTGAAITAQVVFAGTDYSGRPGNYFAHALVTATPEADFGPVLPAELWRADLWQREPGRDAELPELPGPPRPGPIDPAGVQAFLDADGLAGLLPELLTAVSQAMAGAPPVLLACRDTAQCAWCIAALCYLLGERLGRQLTFTTYCHRPESARFQLIGILSGAAPPDAGLSFQFFDLASGLAPGGEAHPLASLLADTGVQAAAALWRQAVALASGAEKGLDDWLPVVTTAAGLLGRPLTPAERTDVARWAGRAASHLRAAAAGAVLGLLLAQPAEPLTTERLIQLLGLAGQAGAADQVADIEDLLIEDAVSRIRAGQPAGPARLSEQGTAAARDRAAGLLEGATARTVRAVLNWAAAWQLGLPEACLEQYGQGCPIGEPPDPDLAQLLRVSTAVRRGLLTQLDNAAPERAAAVLAGPLGSAIRREELAGFPTLAELWLLQAADQGRVAPLRALDEIADARATAGHSPRIDQALLRRLWPDGCPPGQLMELLDLIADDPPDDVARWLSSEAGALAAYWEPDDDWYQLAGVVASHPAREVLAPADLQIMLTAAQAGPLLTRARASAPEGDADVFAELFALYQTAADSRMRGVLDGDLPALLAAAEPLGPALRGCPDPVLLALGRELASRLTAPRADVALAARVFAARADPSVAGQPTQASQLAAACEPVRSWPRREQAAVGRALDGDRAAAKLFGTWRGPTRSARFWRRS